MSGPTSAARLRYLDAPRGHLPDRLRAAIIRCSTQRGLDRIAHQAGWEEVVLHAHGVMPCGATLLSQTSSARRRVATVHSENLPPRSTGEWAVWKAILDSCNAVTAPTKAGAARLRDSFSLSTCCVIPNPVDDLFFSVPLLRTFGSRRLSVLFIGNLVPEKRPLMAIDVAEYLAALDTYERVSLTMVGDGVLRQSVVRKAATAQVDVRLLGPVPNGDLPLLYSAHQVLISTSAWESFGVAIAEALAVGLPVVATATTGATELIPTSEGALVPLDAGPEVFADKVVKAVAQDHPGRAHSRRHEVSGRCSAAAVGKALALLYADVVSQ